MTYGLTPTAEWLSAATCIPNGLSYPLQIVVLPSPSHNATVVSLHIQFF